MNCLIFFLLLVALSKQAFAKRVCQKDADCPSGAGCCIANGKFPRYIENFCFGVIKSGQTCVISRHACCRERDSVQQQIEVRSIREIPKRQIRDTPTTPLTSSSTIIITPDTVNYSEVFPVNQE